MRAFALQLTITIAAAGFAGAALLSGLDRLAAQDGAIPAGIPAVIHWPYARNAPINAAYIAASRHDFGTAIPLMNAALLSDPVDETVIGGLGRVRLTAGDPAGADDAFRVSATRGWRDQVTHGYWMAQSIAVGDFQSAALQADALLNDPLGEPAREQVYNALLEYDGGRNALASRLRARPNWASGVVFDVDHATADQLAARADLIARTGPGVWTCFQTGALIDRLIEAGDTRNATAVHNASCVPGGRPDPSGNALNDPHFVRFATEPRASQFDWFATYSSDVTISPLTNAAGHGGVQIAASRGVAEQVIAQRVAIGPGTYTLTWQMPDSDPASAGKLAAGIECGTDLATAAPGTPVPGKPGTFAVTLRFAGNCATPTLTFWLRPTDRTVTLDAVTLARAGP
ncbi:hypothetical protein [Novosphingobium sp.]|uniref:hypothetical protein n=1 Tax=Novosphingobium sp. TaxID=1874826 RepID=UPI003D0A8202